ncbi:hypothetical protein MMC20_007170 [Loxospora ochrophaea]|nr:hypothetical protein [Loxospora ochrophaea]
MPFGRHPIADHSLTRHYPVERRITNDGCFNGGIFIVRRKKDNTKCLEKRFKPENVVSGEAATEIALLRNLKHRCITEYVDGFVDLSPRSPCAGLIMEFCEGGTLQDRIDNRMGGRSEPIPEPWIWHVFEQLVNGIGYLQHGVEDIISGDRPPKISDVLIHSDLKPGNVFIDTRTFIQGRNGREWPRIVIGDFGLCAPMKADTRTCHLQGTRLQGGTIVWSPPESPLGGTFTDIWAIGAIIQAFCRLDGPPQLGEGPRADKRFRGLPFNYSLPLCKAVSVLMRSDPYKRMPIREFGPRMLKWEDEALEPLELAGSPKPRRRR